MKNHRITFIILFVTLPMLFLFFYFTKQNDNVIQPNASLNMFKEDIKKNLEKTTQDLITENKASRFEKSTVSENKHTELGNQNNDMNYAEKYIVECDFLDSENHPELQVEIDNLNNQLVQQLDIDKPNEFLASILFKVKMSTKNSDDLSEKTQRFQYKKEQISSLISYHEQYPNEPLSFARLLTECSHNNQNYCTDDFINKVTKVDKNNGALWLTIANIQLKRKNFQLANEALYQASISSSFNIHYFELINLYQSIAEKYYPNKYSLSFVSSIGYAAAIYISISESIDYCRKSNVEDQWLQQTCLQLGLQMEAHAEIIIYQLFGIALQKIYHEKFNNIELVAKLEDKSQNQYQGIDIALMNKASALMFFDNELARQWVNNGIQFGEKLAFTKVIEEAIWRSKDPNYKPCPN